MSINSHTILLQKLKLEQGQNYNWNRFKKDWMRFSVEILEYFQTAMYVLFDNTSRLSGI